MDHDNNYEACVTYTKHSSPKLCTILRSSRVASFAYVLGISQGSRHNREVELTLALCNLSINRLMIHS